MDIRKTLMDIRKGLMDIHKGLMDMRKGFMDVRKGLADFDLKQSLSGATRLFSSVENDLDCFLRRNDGARQIEMHL
jgi:hypothetical protein